MKRESISKRDKQDRAVIITFRNLKKVFRLHNINF
jgi:hypothetical protein